jgi:hypothetical protein
VVPRPLSERGAGEARGPAERRQRNASPAGRRGDGPPDAGRAGVDPCGGADADRHDQAPRRGVHDEVVGRGDDGQEDDRRIGQGQRAEGVVAGEGEDAGADQ